ncbi:helix-turn-helix transcriptional regulator [Streptomyces europaeiscabiei]|uniref:winged helix-turn-helix transcriptional regulator n=1 Tax=Streptomyces TaxID=1883 RepID=UPI000A36AFFD|nr:MULTISPECIES: helix-turn-helix domain-containing protein [Streptomyces]MDX3585569.1 helix-turn-helix domain-containing protein [Streptomyces europaeiscabiei]MDX3613148.1 helix-turn-helix domain-containing protein [Streptomyces europaeiscabiei]MDX3633372.1 helix-turn-helix domain-containing protein [Streptomyces europaeiscabiei]MDX3650722.1 helix-turn-helix domain-containing protein [Streptomyces europaeiscabiei]WUD30517.1 helix-turn-helix transcriptional regulator [Streptomyces europaeiscab
MEAVAAQKNAAAPDTLALPVPCSAVPVEHADFIRQVLERIGDKWTLMVIISLRGGGVMRYKDLQSGIPGISQRMLSRTLAQLHQDGLVTRTAYAEVPPRVEYALTPLGASLIGIVGSLIGWAADHHDEIRQHRERFATADAR